VSHAATEPMEGGHQHRTISELLRDVAAQSGEEGLSLFELIRQFGDRSFALLLILLALPSALPVPALPGVTAILAIPMLLIAIQIMFGKRLLWLPGWARRRRISKQALTTLAQKGQKPLTLVEKILKPRLRWMQSYLAHRIFGLILLICAISVATPIPMTNTIPSMGIVLISIGLLERDGLVMLAGTVIGAVGVTIAASVLLLGHQAVVALFGG